MIDQNVLQDDIDALEVAALRLPGVAEAAEVMAYIAPYTRTVLTETTVVTSFAAGGNVDLELDPQRDR